VGVDLVLDCTDNFSSRFAVNRMAVQGRVPLVSGAAIGFQGQVMILEGWKPAHPCYACLFPENSPESVTTCSESGVFAPLLGVMGSLQVVLALQHLAGLRPDSGRLHTFDSLAMAWRSFTVSEDRRCRVCGADPGASV
jgi:adenylyltransferase/sulfurtransferase